MKLTHNTCIYNAGERNSLSRECVPEPNGNAARYFQSFVVNLQLSNKGLHFWTISRKTHGNAQPWQLFRRKEPLRERWCPLNACTNSSKMDQNTTTASFLWGTKSRTWFSPLPLPEVSQTFAKQKENNSNNNQYIQPSTMNLCIVFAQSAHTMILDIMC